MPILPGDDILLRSYPQRSKLYLVVQQCERWQGSLYGEEFLWYARINGAPAGDPTAALTVDNGGPAASLLDRMTVLIGSTPGAWDRGIFSVRGDQAVGPATVTLNIGQTSEITNRVFDNDYVTVLDEFRVWMRKPRIVEAAGALTWYKDYDLLYSALGANAAARRQASLPPVPIMGPHVVRFVPPTSSVWVDFDGSESYATCPAATVNAWSWAGERDSGAWASAVANPAPIEYTSTDISGLAGYRVKLEVSHDLQNPPAQYRRGVRYVFTLRRPGQRQGGDPVNAEPIVNFEVSGMSGSFDQGRWRATVRIYGSDAAETVVLPGALVIVFADDDYAGDVGYIGASENGSVGPIQDRENIVLIGRVTDGSIREDSETGDVTFEIVSVAEQAASREQYPIAIENDDAADEWYECPDLTIFRAVWHYAVWHTTLPLIADFYPFDDDITIPEVFAQDFLASDLYSAINGFLWERRFGRLLYDRYERGACQVDLQVRAPKSGPTLVHLLPSDWLNEIAIREVNEKPCSLADLAGVIYDAGLIAPYQSNAPGVVSGDMGRPDSMRNLAIISQNELNTLSGRYYAYRNNRYPEIRVQLGNWRVGDIWPQEYVRFDTLTVQRKTFTDFWTILREVSYAYDAEAGALFVDWQLEAETDGPPGVTIEIPAELPSFTLPKVPTYPPGTPPTPTNPGILDEGRRIIATNVGVFVTDNIGATTPVWYAANNGFVSAADLNVWDIKRDPHHWWTSGGTERTLWAANMSGIWKHEDFPYGTWVQMISIAQLTAAGMTIVDVNNCRMDFSIEVDDRYAFIFWNRSAGLNQRHYVVVVNGGAIIAFTQIYLTNDGIGWPDIKWAPHGAGNIIYIVAHKSPAHGVGSEATLRKTINLGAAWNTLDTLGIANKGAGTALSIPYVSATNPDAYVMWGRGGHIAGATGKYRISVDQGATFADIPGSSTYTKMGTGGHPDYIWLMTDDIELRFCKWSNDRGVTYTTIGDLVVAARYPWSSFEKWVNGVLQNVLIGTLYTGRLYFWTPATGVWTNKTGNLTIWGPTTIFQIDRDSMGTA